MASKLEREIKLTSVSIQDEFWSFFQNLIQDVVLPYQEKIMKDQIPDIEKSHAIENFRVAAGESQGEFYGMVFQDSDLAKWMEACAYAMYLGKNKEIQNSFEEVLELVKRAQQSDGYLDTYFTLKEPEKRWENLLECHELYCMGHMIEAAVAHYEVTGRRDFLVVAEKMADHIEQRFGKDKVRGIPGHEEIELALLKLYRADSNVKYRDLAAYFINERGTEPNCFAEEKKRRDWDHWPMDPFDRKYSQNHLPVREQKTAEGHSVRAMYLYTAMADLAGELDDEDLKMACEAIWEDAVNKKMYITGGIGSTFDGAAFTIPYDLPNDMAYAETCASIGMVFFSRKMLQLSPESKYADIMERELYNGIISGMQHDGSRFFYVNPLEVVPGISGKLFGYRHALSQRPEWYACACCPPNVSRMIGSLGKYVWGESADGSILYSHLFVGGSIKTEDWAVTLTTNYPWNGTMHYKIEQAVTIEKSLAIRVPGWCTEYQLFVNGEKIKTEEICRDGYLYLCRKWQNGDTVVFETMMPAVRLYANDAVRDNAGCVALMRGPLVFCLEEIDNGEKLHSVQLSDQAEIQVCMEEDAVLGKHPVLRMKGYRESTGRQLYSSQIPQKAEAELKAIPYYLWGNRGLGEMRVWIRRA